MTDCLNCEYNRQRAQLWRDEAYRQAGHPLPEREQEHDYKDLYEKEKRKSAMWLSKYEEVAGPAPKAIPMAQPEQEPVACKECHLKDLVYDLLGELKVANLKLSVRAKRPWVGLTDQEIGQVFQEKCTEHGQLLNERAFRIAARWAEEKLKERNK